MIRASCAGDHRSDIQHRLTFAPVIGPSPDGHHYRLLGGVWWDGDRTYVDVERVR